MIILIILIVLITIGVILTLNYKYFKYEDIGIVLVTTFGMYLTIHIIGWSTAKYSYNKFVVKRNAFIETLNNARKNNNIYEQAAIVKQISEWNTELADRKYDNNTFIFGDYFDNRIELLEPIK